MLRYCFDQSEWWTIQLTHLPLVTHICVSELSQSVQVMACRLFGTKPLPEPILVYFKLDSWEQISVKLEWEFYHFHSRKCIWKCRLPNWRPFCPGEDELYQTALMVYYHLFLLFHYLFYKTIGLESYRMYSQFGILQFFNCFYCMDI